MANHKKISWVHSAVPSLLENDEVIGSNREKADILNSYFCKQSTLSPAQLDHHLPEFQYLTNARISSIEVTAAEVRAVLNKLNTNKATGPDGISNKILRESAFSLCEPLADLFNRSLSLGLFPTNWKIANVIPVHKKGSRQLKSNYRPVSLLSNVSKVLERLVYNKLYEYCKRHNILTDRNSGFKHGDSTINRLSHLIHRIYQGLDDRKEIALVFLDITKAFDRVWHPGLLHKLKQMGVGGALLDWLRSYLSKRSQKVVLGGDQSNVGNTNAGVPQGSILGPLLFLIFINDIVDDLENDLFLFADDATLVKEIENVRLTEMSINRDLARLTQ